MIVAASIKRFIVFFLSIFGVFFLNSCAMFEPTPQAPSRKSIAIAVICGISPPDPEGAYFLPDAPFKTILSSPDTPGRRLIISGTVFASDCKAVLTGAKLEIWQADASGNYDFSEHFWLRGNVKTDENGRYQFETILPAQHGSRRARIHFKIYHPEAGPLTTQLFFSEVYDPNKENGSGTVINILEDSGVLRGEFNITMPPQQSYHSK